MNRGTARMNIAYDKNDFAIFTKTLTELRRDYGIRILSFCLMTNHYHLLVQTPQGNLTRAMRHFGHCYTQRFNWAHDRDGALFRGRYKAIVIEGESYLRQLIRYIHLNPVSARLVNRPENYSWSSYRHLMDRIKDCEWLDKENALHFFAADSIRNAQSKLKAFVDEGNLQSLETFYSRNRLPPILCDEAVIRTLENLVDRKKAASS
jgi:REP element-mobilizing transposase RayT